jgi:methionyl-tRNA synthetase
LWTTAEVLRMVGILIQPYVPGSAAKLLDLLAVPETRRSFADYDQRLVSGTSLPAPAPIFPRYIEEPAKPA